MCVPACVHVAGPTFGVVLGAAPLVLATRFLTGIWAYLPGQATHPSCPSIGETTEATEKQESSLKLAQSSPFLYLRGTQFLLFWLPELWALVMGALKHTEIQTPIVVDGSRGDWVHELQMSPFLRLVQDTEHPGKHSV